MTFLEDPFVARQLKIFRLENQPQPPRFTAHSFNSLWALQIMYVQGWLGCCSIELTVGFAAVCRFFRNVSLSAVGLPARVFSGLPNLAMLGMPENQLAYVQADWWAPLAGNSSIQVLDLHMNKLSVLAAGAFDVLAPSLVSLDLHVNELVTLPERLFGVMFPVLVNLYV